MICTHTHMIEAWEGDHKVLTLWVSYGTDGGAIRRFRKEIRQYSDKLRWKLFRAMASGHPELKPFKVGRRTCIAEVGDA